MTTSGRRVPPGAPEPKHTVVKRYFPSRSARMAVTPSPWGDARSSMMASPPQSSSGQAKATMPASAKGTASRASGRRERTLPKRS